MATTAIQQQQDSLIEQMAHRFNLKPAIFYQTVKNTLMPNGGRGVTDEQVAAFLVVAHQYSLNPFTKEIFAFPANGGVQPVVSVDGWSTIINRQPNLDGIEFTDNLDASGKALMSITCRIYRKDRNRPVEVTEYMSECARSTEPWKKWPARMLRHKALIQCARYAFALTGIYDPDEAERIAESGATRPAFSPGGTHAAQSSVDKLASKYAIAAPAIDAEVLPHEQSEPPVEAYDPSEAHSEAEQPVLGALDPFAAPNGFDVQTRGKKGR